jgi:ammonia channel protein AmtB
MQNVLSTVMQSFSIACLITVEWIIIGVLCVCVLCVCVVCVCMCVYM